MKMSFRGHKYEVIFTDHAIAQMNMRGLDQSSILNVIETGEFKQKEENKFWIYKALTSRKDNLISVAAVIEKPRLIVVTAMVNWRPK